MGLGAAALAAPACSAPAVQAAPCPEHDARPLLPCLPAAPEGGEKPDLVDKASWPCRWLALAPPPAPPLPPYLAARAPAACRTFRMLGAAFQRRPASVPLQFLGPDMLPRREQNRLHRQEIIAGYERFRGDTGSTEVQGGPWFEGLLQLAK